MKLGDVMLSKISQTKEDKYCAISCMWNLEELKSETERRVVVTSGWGMGGGQMGRCC